MTQFTINAQDGEAARRLPEIRLVVLDDQIWVRNRSADLAQREGIGSSDDHGAVMVCLRRHYLEHGLARKAKALAKILSQRFSVMGGCKYLHYLSLALRLHKGAVLATCRRRQTAPAFRLAAVIDKQ